MAHVGIPLLLNFPVGGGATINIIQKIGTNYLDFGTYLLDDNDGHNMKALELQYKFNAESITTEIFQTWFKGNRRLPVTWSTLVTALRHGDLNTLADQIEGHPYTGKPKISPINATQLDKNVEVVTSDNMFVQDCCKSVDFILHTASPLQRTACLSKMNPPKGRNKIIRFTNKMSDEFTLGTFGGYNAALVQTKQGSQCQREIESAIDEFANATAIIGVGVAYGGCGIMLGDVLVSEKIAELDTTKFQNDNTVASRGEKRAIEKILHNTFCKSPDLFESFVCTQGPPYRCAKVYCGIIISGSFLVNNEDFKKKLFKIEPEAIGGEMEGFVLMEIIRHYRERRLGAIIIKGVSDYGGDTKEESWQPIAALAAVEYTHQMLERTNGTLATQRDSVATKESYNKATKQSDGGAAKQTDVNNSAAATHDKIINPSEHYEVPDGREERTVKQRE